MANTVRQILNDALYPIAGWVGRLLSAKIAEQISITDFGAIGDAQQVGITTTVGLGFTGFSGYTLTSADVGKAICIPIAGAAGVDLITTVATVTSGTTGTLALAASSAITRTDAWIGTDNAAAINNCLAYAMTSKKVPFIPAGAYAHTKSLNYSTNSTVTTALGIDGENKYASKIICMMNEAFPALDCTGTSRAHFRNFTIQGVGGLATTAALWTYATTGGSGPVSSKGITVENCCFTGYFANFGTVAANSDLIAFRSCEFILNGVKLMYIGATAAPGISSKFQTIFAVTDSTQQYIYSCTCVVNPTRAGVANVASGIDYGGGQSLEIFGLYTGFLGLVSGGAAIRLASGFMGSNAVRSSGWRVEQNNGASAGCSAYDISAGTGSNDCSLKGTFNLGNPGYVMNTLPSVGSPIIAQRVEIDSGAAISALFAPGSKILGFRANSSFPVGTLSSDSLLIDFSQINSTASLATILGSNSLRGAVVRNNVDYSVSMWSQLIAPSNLSQAIKPVGCALDTAPTLTPYTGGSGEQLSFSVTLPAQSVQRTGNPGFNQSQIIKLNGRIQATAAAAGAMRFNVLQGSNTVDLISITGIPAFVAGQTGFWAEISLLNVGSGSASVSANITVGIGATIIGANHVNLAAASPAAITFASDMTLRFYVNNTGNDPYQALAIRADM